MFRMIRVPRTLDKFFRPLQCHFRWDHFAYFRLLVLAMACAWGRHHVTNLYRYLDAQPHRTRFTNFFLVQRWDPERTFAWLLLFRRLSKDDEELPATSEALASLARSRLMVKCLAHA